MPNFVVTQIFLPFLYFISWLFDRVYYSENKAFSFFLLPLPEEDTAIFNSNLLPIRNSITLLVTHCNIFYLLYLINKEILNWSYSVLTTDVLINKWDCKKQVKKQQTFKIYDDIYLPTSYLIQWNWCHMLKIRDFITEQSYNLKLYQNRNNE